MNRYRTLPAPRLWVGILLLGFSTLIAQNDSDDKKSADKKPATIAEKTKNATKFEGLFTFYQDQEDGTTYMLIRADQLDKEYVYFAYIENGIVEVGLFRGRFRGSRIFRMRRYFDRIEFVTPNTSHYFDPESPLSRASEANINAPVMVSAKIEALDKRRKHYLIKADDLFLTEGMLQIKPSPDPESDDKNPFKLGDLNEDKTKYLAIRNYPRNTDILVEYVYDNKAPSNRGGAGVTNARAISVTVQHSLIQMPENAFQPRFDDPRIGYFTTRVTDMTSTSPTPYRDLIHRWNLVKQDPAADLSEPLQPIVWWIENTTPHEFREARKNGVLAWNSAFEKAGFKNAIQVRIQPDDAAWDAGDIRYNVLRWTSSPQPPFGGYGPSFVNPRSGEIIGADIMLEWVHFTNRVLYTQLYKVGAEPAESDDPLLCSAGYYLHQGNLFGSTVLMTDGATGSSQGSLTTQSLMRLALHEVGHTLGLNHNMRSSQMLGLDQIHDAELTTRIGLTGSVMEYPAINVSLDRTQQGEYYGTTPGPYDDWAIEFGYSTALVDPTAEAARLEKILGRSAEPGLAFGNDADDMRRSSRGIDPRVMIYDLSSDAIGYATQRMQLVNRLYPELRDRFAREGGSYQATADAFNILSREYRLAAGVISRYVGGIYVDRAFVGQAGGGAPLQPVPYQQQKRAMQVLSKMVFAPGAYKIPADLYQYLQQQRRGFDFFRTTEDPKLHRQVLRIQTTALDHLLHKNTLQRLSDTRLYGNRYSLIEFMGDLTSGIFAADAGRAVSSYRQNLQTEYVQQLTQILDSGSGHSHMVRAAAHQQLLSIKKLAKPKGDAESRAHRQYLQHLVGQALREG